MVTLALDTTTRTATCAAAVDGRIVGEWTGHADRSPAAQLPAGLDAALQSAGLRPADVDVLAVTVGPGSFTGLRVGIAAMQGLAVALGRPLIGVSGLEALAAHAAEAEPGASSIAAWVDAWRGEVYAACYEAGRETQNPVVAAPADVLARLAGPVLFVGDGAATHRDAIAAWRRGTARLAAALSPALAPVVARLATRRARAGELPGPDEVMPLYVRRPDAELARDGRHA